MKAVILAGGRGTRISEETSTRPKPMVEIGGRPILWHIMKIYSHWGINDFIICCGYKGYLIKEYFFNYALHCNDVVFDMKNHTHSYLRNQAEPWRVTLVDTGFDSMTGGRLKRVADYIGDETFLCTYGDGVANIDIKALVAFHKQQKKLMTATAVQPEGRFGAFLLEKDQLLIREFREKPKGDGAWINGGFFVMEPEVLGLIRDDAEVLEERPMRRLSENEQLIAFRHDGFWHSMDTLRDKHHLEEYWRSGSPPWKVWR